VDAVIADPEGAGEAAMLDPRIEQVHALLEGKPIAPPSVAALREAEKAGIIEKPELQTPRDVAAAAALGTAAAAKEAGNVGFKAAAYGAATACYERAAELAEAEGAHAVAMAALANLAAAWLKAGWPGRAEAAASRALGRARSDDGLGKLYFRRCPWVHASCVVLAASIHCGGSAAIRGSGVGLHIYLSAEQHRHRRRLRGG
jgi:hypothetical protein